MFAVNVAFIKSIALRPVAERDTVRIAEKGYFRICNRVGEKHVFIGFIHLREYFGIKQDNAVFLAIICRCFSAEFVAVGSDLILGVALARGGAFPDIVTHKAAFYQSLELAKDIAVFFGICKLRFNYISAAEARIIECYPAVFFAFRGEPVCPVCQNLIVFRVLYKAFHL